MKLTAIYSFLSENTFLLPLAIISLTLVTLFLTLVPSNFVGDSPIWDYDKLGHIALFGSWTYVLGLYLHISRSVQTKIWVIFWIGVSFGVAIEILQYLLPFHRHADPVDVLFDTLGCLLAIWVLKKTIPE
jgi:VanZ family protein